MIPEATNVYGEVVCQTLETVLEAARCAFPWERAYIYESGYDGAQTMHLRAKTAEFDSEPLGGNLHLLNGAVGGDAISLLQSLSRELRARNVQHRFELYDESGGLVVTLLWLVDHHGEG